MGTMELSEVIQMAVVEDMKKNAREFLGNDEYKLGDITKEIDTRVKSQVATMRGKEEYEIGDISKEIEKKRRSWVKNYLGEDAAKDYMFGDITKKAFTKYTGKDDYEFGDVTKKLMGNIFGGKKKLK